GAINVTSSPSGARVFLDGQEKGYTPLFIRDVPLGDHEIVLVVPGYYAVTHQFEMSYPGTFYISRSLRPIPKR
ncbi:MAG TPA: PEGA domain-containing protein, partial [Firmicutes bacterium]|nr:PEGA domain-containing protein [Bacillota bacterium]